MTEKEKIEFLEEVMELDEGSLTKDTELNELEEWDSLSTLVLTVEIRNRFGENLTAKTIKDFKTVGDICQYLEQFK